MPNNDQGVAVPFSPIDQADLAVLHGQLQRHRVAQAHLSGQNIKYDGAFLTAADRIALPEPLGNVTTLELAHLFSIFNGSRVHQQVQNANGPDDAPPGLYFTVINRRILQYKNRTGLFKEDALQAGLFIHGLHIDHFFLRKTNSGVNLATIAIALCAITAQLKRLGTISLIAAGGKGYSRRHVGFKVWPKLGFDAKLLPGETDDDPHLQFCQTVQDVLRIDPEWWSANGSQRLMRFDLSPNSASWRKLIPYVHEKVLSAGPI
jgi:hypothetical protein